MKDAVYLLSSILNPDKTYTGQSSRCVYVRLAEHNRGQTSYTKRLRPLRLVVSVWGFNSKAAAMRFEKLWKRRSRGGLVAHLEALVRLVRSRNDLHIISHVTYSSHSSQFTVYGFSSITLTLITRHSPFHWVLDRLG